jgi:lysozyme
VGSFLKKLILLLFLTIFIKSDSIEVLNMAEKITKVSKQAIELIKKFEGFCAQPYLCPANVPTIGYGATFYEDGKKVQVADPAISEARATQLLQNVLKTFEKHVDSYTRDDITQSQFDALVCFAYNVGVGALKSSTLLKLVNTNPSEPLIKNEFLKWNKAAGRVLKGLTKRREAEANLYFKN